MYASVSMARDKYKAPDIGGQGEQGDTDHGGLFWRTASDDSPPGFRQGTEGKSELQPPCDPCSGQLMACIASDCIQRDPVDGCVSEHISSIRDQSRRFCPPPGDNFDNKHQRVNA